jgi:glucokinase
MTSAILVGDLGGTHTRLALATLQGGQVCLTGLTRFENRSADGLPTLIRGYLAGAPRPRLACLAVAGPTDGHRVSFTNLNWQVDSTALAAEFGFAAVRLINDFLAVGYGLDALGPGDLAVLQRGVPVPQATRAALGAGTGLGVVQSVWDGRAYRPLASEGGHIAFAPVDEEQVSLWHFLQAEFGRVSVERLLSGPGISALYRFCRAASGRPIKRERDPAEVTAAALGGDDPTAAWALRLFSRIYGQTAGDLALLAQARGGVYLAGGIAPRILPLLQSPEFLAGFRQKGRFSGWMEAVPVQVILDPDIGLKGAALAALAGA